MGKTLHLAALWVAGCDPSAPPPTDVGCVCPAPSTTRTHRRGSPVLWRSAARAGERKPRDEHHHDQPGRADRMVIVNEETASGVPLGRHPSRAGDSAGRWPERLATCRTPSDRRRRSGPRGFLPDRACHRRNRRKGDYDLGDRRTTEPRGSRAAGHRRRGGVLPGDVEVVVRTGVGKAAEEVENRSGDMGLVVLGSRGSGPARTMLFGRISSQVVPEALCPVMILAAGRGSRRGLDRLERVPLKPDSDDPARRAVIADRRVRRSGQGLPPLPARAGAASAVDDRGRGDVSDVGACCRDSAGRLDCGCSPSSRSGGWPPPAKGFWSPGIR